MFNISENKGFEITFDNGWTASVQWGAGNYCSNHDLRIGASWGEPVPPSASAEIAAWGRAGQWLKFKGKDVKGYCSPEEVAKFLARVAKFTQS